VIVAAATAATWVVSQPPRKFGAAQVEVASVGNAASAAAESHAIQPRRGAGTVGARAGSLGAVAAPGEYDTRASQNGGAEDVQGTGRAPRPAPKPDLPSVSTDAPADASAAPSELAWSGQGVEAIAPPTPGRDPRDRESVRESDPPPDPTTIASGFPPPAPAPAPPVVTPPRVNADPGPGTTPPPVTTNNPPPPPIAEPPPGPDVAVPSVPVTPEIVADNKRDALAGVPDDQLPLVEPPVQREMADRGEKLGGWTGAGSSPLDPAGP
jgi:hypothetical protein